MDVFLIIWLVVPMLVSFGIYLIPKVSRILALGLAVLSMLVAVQLITMQGSLDLTLMDSFGVALRLDNQSGFFVLTNSLVTAAVILYCWHSDRSAYFYTQLSILHGCLNSIFACNDLISLYVAIECASIAVFLLITYGRSNRKMWVALRYLLVSNTVMLFYLLGAGLVYETNMSFAFSSIQQAPIEAIVLILVGLLTKGGVFISGLWLPLTHSESDIPVSAMLSGIAIKAGIFPLLRLAELVDGIDVTVRVLGIGTAFLGVSFAIFERDIKRIFALSTVSQMGFVLAVPSIGGIYALSHGLAKATLFLTASGVPSRRLDELRQKPMGHGPWAALTIAGLSMSGCPLLLGFGAKSLVLKNVLPWQTIPLTIAAVGTAILFARLIFLPHTAASEKKAPASLWPSVTLLLGGLVVANGVSWDAYTWGNGLKAIATIGAGWGVYQCLPHRSTWRLPSALEQLENLIGVLSLLLIGLFAWSLA